MDLKGVGYLISSISVFFLGIVAWPSPSEPRWHAVAVLLGMVLSIVGMGVRFMSHQKDRKDIRRAAQTSRRKDDQIWSSLATSSVSCRLASAS